MASLLRPSFTRALRRWSYLVSLALVAGTILYMAALDAAVRTHLFRNAFSSDPSKVWLEYRDAHALSPWRLHVDGLVLRGRDSAVEWILRIDAVDFDFSALALLKKKFHADHVRGRGISFVLRLEEAEAHPGHDAYLPDVPGFANPPLRDIGPVPSHDDGEYNLWEVRLRDVIARDVREVWIDTLRIDGDMTVRADWLFRPLRWLDLGHPATVELGDVAVAHGKEAAMLDRWKGRIDVSVDPFDVRVPEGLDVLHYVSLHSTSESHVALDRAAELLGARAGQVSGEAIVAGKIDVDHGILSAPTALALRTMDSAARVGPLRVEASVEARAAVEIAGGPPELHLTVRAPDVLAQAEGALVRSAEIVGRGESARLDLADPFGDLRGSLDLRGGRVPDLAPWARVLPLPQGLALGGDASFEAHLEGDLPGRRAHGALDASSEGVAVSYRGSSVRTKIGVNAHLVDADLERKAVDLSGSQITLSGTKLSVRGVDGSIAGATAHAAAARFGRGPSEITVEAKARGVRVPALGQVARLLPEGAPRIEGGSVEADLEGRFSTREGAVRGSGQARVRDLSVRQGTSALRTDAAVRLEVRRFDLASKAFDVSGSSVKLERAGVDVEVAKGKGSVRATLPEVDVAATRLGRDDHDVVGQVDVSIPPCWIVPRGDGILLLPSETSRLMAGPVRAEGRAVMTFPQRTLVGHLDAEAEESSLARQGRTLSGRLNVHLQAVPDGLVGSSDVSGSWVTFREKRAAEDALRVDLALSDAHLQLAGTPAIEGLAHVRANDSRPLAPWIAEPTPVPTWLAKLALGGPTTVDAGVLVSKERLELHGLEAKSGSFSARVELRQKAGDTVGAALFELGPVHAAAQVGKSSRVVLFGAERWYASLVDALRRGDPRP